MSPRQRKNTSILIALVAVAVSGSCALAACPSADLSGDCFVNFNDFALLAVDWPATDYNDLALMAAQWLTTDPCIPNDMAYIPGGRFAMGDSLGEGWSDERPVHSVTLDSFYMGKFEVTNGQYCQYLNSAIGSTIYVSGGVVYGSGNNQPYCDTSTSISSSQIDYSGGVFSVRSKSGRSMFNDPMARVTWYGAVAYCNWRSQQDGKEQCYNLSTWDCDFNKKGYRLPTEAEWEYAARGGLAGRRFPWGDTISHGQANYYSYWEGGRPYYLYDVSPTERYHPTWNDGVLPYTSPGGSFAANNYRLYDTAGNVWEWSNDWYSVTYYSWSPTSNPTGPTSGSGRVLRGGSWDSYAYACRVAHRHDRRPSLGYDTLGFRLVLGF
jgi:sulfatase modifying factor 1